MANDQEKFFTVLLERLEDIAPKRVKAKIYEYEKLDSGEYVVTHIKRGIPSLMFVKEDIAKIYKRKSETNPNIRVSTRSEFDKNKTSAEKTVLEESENNKDRIRKEQEDQKAKAKKL